MAGKHKDGLAPELLDKLIVQRGARGALDFESLATELKKAWPSACWVRSWSSICPIRRNWKPATTATASPARRWIPAASGSCWTFPGTACAAPRAAVPV